jgi:hypothetical protein
MFESQLCILTISRVPCPGWDMGDVTLECPTLWSLKLKCNNRRVLLVLEGAVQGSRQSQAQPLFVSLGDKKNKVADVRYRIELNL